MGNNCVYPKYNYPYKQPTDFSWKEYISQCSSSYSKNLETNFRTNFSGKVIEWKGLVTKIGPNKIYMFMNPTDSMYASSELTLLLNKDTEKVYANAKVKEVLTFRGRLVQYGLY